MGREEAETQDPSVASLREMRMGEPSLGARSQYSAPGKHKCGQMVLGIHRGGHRASYPLSRLMALLTYRAGGLSARAGDTGT